MNEQRIRAAEEPKLVSLEALGAHIARLQQEGRRVVHCHGVFDLLHVGHIKHLQAARQQGDLLVVTISPDRFVNKGPRRPAFHEGLRAEALAALACVSFVAINRWPSAVETIGLLKPDVYCKGLVRGEEQRDFSDAIQLEQAAIEAVGGRLYLTDEETFSATTLINDQLELYPPQVRDYLNGFRERYSVQDVIEPFKAVRALKILTVGEVIIDEYVFCQVMGKANKDPILAARHLSTDTYAGGILAVANHLAGFCPNVSLLSMVGEQDSRLDFIQQKLNTSIRPLFLRKAHAPTIVKRRFLEEYMAVKLFEVYEMRNEQLSTEEEDMFCDQLEALLPHYDVVVVADYGHGLLTDRAIELLCRKARFLVVNAQTNAGNRGFNFITRYARADYISIDEPEARLEARNRKAEERDLVSLIARSMDCQRIMLTVGKRGSIAWDAESGFHQVPAFATSALDRLGAGDAVLAITAPLVALGLPMELIGFIGNVAGAEACGIMGNKNAINPSSFFRHIHSLIK